MSRIAVIVSVILLGSLGLWYLPITLDSSLAAFLLGITWLGTVIWGWRKHRWLAATLLGTTLVLADFFGVVHSFPQFLWLVLAALWAGGVWLVGHVDTHQSRIFHQALASFLVVEVFLVMLLWPINVLSKSVIAMSFALFLWHEFVRAVPTRQRLQESIVPFLLIVILMALTGHWIIS